MANNKVFVEVIKGRLDRLTGREKLFGNGVVQFWEAKGYLSEKQSVGASKLAARLIQMDKLSL